MTTGILRIQQDGKLWGVMGIVFGWVFHVLCIYIEQGTLSNEKRLAAGMEK